jgi:hypothetical protein
MVLKSRLRLKISLSSLKMAGFAPHSTGWPTENRHSVMVENAPPARPFLCPCQSFPFLLQKIAIL